MALHPISLTSRFQSSVDVTLDRRILWYNVLLRYRHGIPVRSVVILLRPEAQSPTIVGRIIDDGWPGNFLDFRYKTVRVWEQSPQSLPVAGGLGTLPLAPISARSRKWSCRMWYGGWKADLSGKRQTNYVILEAAACILLGLRFPKEMIGQILSGVRQMKESVTYQAIWEEGEAAGEARGEAKGQNQRRTRSIN